jgi:hypothetical protein
MSEIESVSILKHRSIRMEGTTECVKLAVTTVRGDVYSIYDYSSYFEEVCKALGIKITA